MGCLGVDIRILDFISDLAVRAVNGLSVAVTAIKQRICTPLQAEVNSISDFNVLVNPLSGTMLAFAGNANTSLSVQVSTICTPDVSQYYLEIEPEILWVYSTWENYNNVYSNTDWIVT